MRTWEIMEKIHNNAESMLGKEYKLISTHGNDIGLTTGDKMVIGKLQSGITTIFDKHGFRITCLTGFEEWEKVKEPVDFMTAIKSGKHIGVEYSGAKYKEMSLPNLFYELQQDYSHETIKQFILYGEWYIEED